MIKKSFKNKKIKLEAFFIFLIFIVGFFLTSIGVSKENSSNKLDYFQLEKIFNRKVQKNSYQDYGSFKMDRNYILEPLMAPNFDDENKDAGYKRDAGDILSESDAIYPGEIIDNWPGRGRTGLLSLTDTEDWYYFSVCEGQLINLSMKPFIGYDFDLSLWDSEIERMSSTNSGNLEESIIFNADKTGYWYIRIYFVDGSNEGEYSFDIKLNGQNDANTYNDAGNSFINATLIKNTGIYHGYLDMNDEEDWYKFNINQGDNIFFRLKMEKYAAFSDFDIYLYNPTGSLVHYNTYYYDDKLSYPADVSGQWRVKIKIFPGYSDIPNPIDWEYFTYGSGAYRLYFELISDAEEPLDSIPQPEIIPIAHTFKIFNDPSSNEDEYCYLSSIPACNFIENQKKYLAPIVYIGDKTPTNWYGNVDDSTNYLLDSWNTFLKHNNKTVFEYDVPSNPIDAAADIANSYWVSSDIAVVAIDGSNFKDKNKEIINKTIVFKRNCKISTIPNDSNKIIEFRDYYIFPMLIRPKWGAINISIYGDDIPGGIFQIYPILNQLCPKYMSLTSDWWPAYPDEPRNDMYYPLTSKGLWSVGSFAPLGDWQFRITKYNCNRHRLQIDEADSVLNVTIKTEEPSDLILFLIDPNGHIRAPDLPDWNGGLINPIHQWNGLDNGDYSTSCSPYKSWNLGPHTEFSAEVLHPEKGKWTAIVVPRNAEGANEIKYTIQGKLKIINPDRADAAISAANAAVIASLEHAPLLFVNKDSIPIETTNAFSSLGVNKVIFVERNNIGQDVVGSLPTKEADLTDMQSIVDYIKDYKASENYITITSIKSGDGYFAPAAMLAAYHGSPVLRIGDAPGNPAGMANKIDTWRLWKGDYYHGNRAPGHLPIFDEPVEDIGDLNLLLKLIRYFFSIIPSEDLPPLGMDAKRYWNEEMYLTFHDWIDVYGLDTNGKESYVFVAPREDIRLELHSVMMGNNSCAGHIPGETASYISNIVVRNILYPALIYANPNKDVTTTQLMNFPDDGSWKANNGSSFPTYTTRAIKNTFMSHNRIYEGHCLWDAHLKRMNDGTSIMYYSGHGTGGSGISAQYYQTDYSNYPDQIWPDAWRGYMYDNWKTARDNGRRWYNPEPLPISSNLYDIIHNKWMDKLFGDLNSSAIFYQSCSTGQHTGPLVYLDHGAVIWYGNAGSGLCPQSDLIDEWFFVDAMIKGKPIGQAYSKYIWLHYRDYTTSDPTSMYGPSSLHGDEGITTVHCIYGDPNLILYSPEWTLPLPIDSPMK